MEARLGTAPSQVPELNPSLPERGNDGLRLHRAPCPRASVTRRQRLYLSPRKGIDMQPLPSNFAELSELAKRLEEDADAVRTEAREKLDERREKIRTNLSERMDRLESNLEKAQS